MSFRQLGLLFTIVVAFCLLSPSAYAQDCGIITACDPDFYSWGDASGNYNPPTTNTCYAMASSNQSCRQCAPAYNDNGTFKGYFVCAYLLSNGSCSCKGAGTIGCSNVGFCRYYP